MELKYWGNKGFILCPHCEYKISDVWDYEFPIQDGYESEIDCPDCFGRICVMQSIETRYTSSKRGEME